MNYKVLYRKYRPKNFDEIVGQNNTIHLLKECIINNKISHAYIFSGPRGTGKTSSAKIFAKTINCLKPKDGNPCEECDNCLNFENNSDIYEIDAASNNGVDQIREIIDNIKLTPINSKYKVYIIDEVHMLSTSAFNALLLTLEEPPSHVVFILATTDIENVPITVLSRCQRMDFKRVQDTEIEKLIKSIAKIEKINIETDAIKEITEYVDGGVRDALSILDQVSKNNEIISREIILNTIGSVSDNKINEFINNLDEGNIENVIKFVEFIRDKNVDFKVLIKKTINILEKRAIIEKKEDNDEKYNKYKNLCLELAGLSIKNSVNVDLYTLYELVVLDYCKKINKIISREIIENNIEKTENLPKKRLGNNVNGYNELIKIRINNCFVGAKKSILDTNKISWNKFIENNTDRKIKSLITDFELVLSSGDMLVFKNSFNDKVNKFNTNINLIENSFNDYNNSNYKIVATTSDNWENEMNRYKDNIRNNIKYSIIPEPDVAVDEDINSIFGKSKVEIKEE